MGGLLGAFPGAARAADTPEGGSAGEDLTALTLSEASARIHNRSVTSTQLTQALLARIAVYNPMIDAYITVMAAEAL